MDVGLEVKGEIRGTGVIRDKHGNVKAHIEIRGEATQKQYEALRAQVKDNGSDTLDSGS